MLHLKPTKNRCKPCLVTSAKLKTSDCTQLCNNRHKLCNVIPVIIVLIVRFSPTGEMSPFPSRFGFASSSFLSLSVSLLLNISVTLYSSTEHWLLLRTWDVSCLPSVSISCRKLIYVSPPTSWASWWNQRIGNFEHWKRRNSRTKATSYSDKSSIFFIPLMWLQVLN